jgi:hypothetical protein
MTSTTRHGQEMYRLQVCTARAPMSARRLRTDLRATRQPSAAQW